MAEDYSNRELDSLFSQLHTRMDAFEKTTSASLGRIEKQTTQHNHRMTKIEKWMLVVGTATVVVIALKLPDLAPLFHIL